MRPKKYLSKSKNILDFLEGFYRVFFEAIVGLKKSIFRCYSGIKKSRFRCYSGTKKSRNCISCGSQFTNTTKEEKKSGLGV